MTMSEKELREILATEAIKHNIGTQFASRAMLDLFDRLTLAALSAMREVERRSSEKTRQVAERFVPAYYLSVLRKELQS